MPRRVALVVLSIALILRAAATYYGYDRRPVITSNDEIYWAEPAWALLHGEGYTMPCCRDRIFGDFYPQHPPVYVLILAASFYLFGFGPAAMRLPSLCAHAVGIILLLFLLRRFRRMRFLDSWGFWIAVALALGNFTTFAVARMGRPDPFTTDFALMGFLVLFGGRPHPQPERRRAAIAGVLIGLALSTHTVAIFYFLLFVVGLWALRSRLGRFWLAWAAIPCAVFAACWFATFGCRSFEALQRHLDLAKQMGGAVNSMWRGFDLLRTGQLQTFIQAGGTTAFLILGSFGLVVFRWITDRSQPIAMTWKPVAIAFAGQLTMIATLTGLGYSRCYIYFPFTIIAIGVLLSHWRPPWRTIVAGLLIVQAIGETSQVGYYLVGTHRDYELRSPHRFDWLIDRLATYRRVAVLPVLWYQARARGLDFVLVDLSVPEQRDEWTKMPDAFREFDAVILIGGDPIENHPDLVNAKREIIPDSIGQDMMLFLRR